VEDDQIEERDRIDQVNKMTCLSGQRAFTLVELMVSLALLAIMATILYGSFYLGHRAAEKAEARMEDSQRLRSLGDLLGGYIRSAYPYRSSPRDPVVLFFGEREKLTFVSMLSMEMGGRGMSKISLYRGEDAKERSVFILEEEIPAWGAGYTSRLVLRTGVEELGFEYLDVQGADDRWLSEWDGARRRMLPQAVRVSLSSYDGNRDRWVFPIMVRVLTP